MFGMRIATVSVALWRGHLPVPQGAQGIQFHQGSPRHHRPLSSKAKYTDGRKVRFDPQGNGAPMSKPTASLTWRSVPPP